tara:strand:- start:1679 stop:2440 length:762 start_codon:yes stop_codon:yes gene_type:complete
MEVTRYKDLNLDKLSYSKPENQQNVYYGPMQYKEKNLHIHTAKLTIKEVKEDESSNLRYLVVSVDPNDFSFYDMLVRLDDHNLASTYKFSKDWFSKELPMDVLETMYRRITKPFKKGTIPIIELKLPFLRKKYQCSFYDVNNQVISVDKLIPGSEIIAIINVKGLKFLKKDYYCDIHISQVKLYQTESYPLFDKCLISDDSSTNYDYEIIDEEMELKYKEKIQLLDKINQLTQKIESDQKELTDLKKKIETLN